MRSFSPDSTSTYRSRGTESNFTSPVAGITRTSIIVSERVDVPSAALGLRSTPRTSTSSGSPEASSASLDASCLASLDTSSLASGATLRVDLFLASVVGSRLRDDARSFTVLCAGARVSSAGIVLESPCASNPPNEAGTKLGEPAVSAAPAEPPPSALKKAAACIPIPKNTLARTSTARSRRRRYRARLHRLRFERARLLVFFKAPTVSRSWQAHGCHHKPTKLTEL